MYQINSIMYIYIYIERERERERKRESDDLIKYIVKKLIKIFMNYINIVIRYERQH